VIALACKGKAMQFKQALLILLVPLLFLAVGTGRAQDTINIGIILPMTGAKATFGEIEKKSFQLALEEINAAGGIKGKPLQFLIEDDMGRPEAARAAAEKLITKDKVAMLSGGYGSSETYAVAGVAQQNKIPFLVNTAAADKITEQRWDYIFRLNPPVSEYPKGLKSFLKEVVAPETCVILHENTLFGTEGAEEFQQMCQTLNLRVLFTESYEHGGIDFKPLLIKIKKAQPDLIYMISYIMDASLLMRQASELKLTPKAFIGGGAGFTLSEFVASAGKASEKVFSATLWFHTLPFPGANDYYEKFIRKYKTSPDYHGAEAYAAAQVMADVLRRTTSLASADILQALRKTDVMTVFGPVRFVAYDQKSNQNRADTYVVQWIQGKLELIWPKKYASTPFVYPVDWLKEWGYK